MLKVGELGLKNNLGGREIMSKCVSRAGMMVSSLLVGLLLSPVCWALKISDNADSNEKTIHLRQIRDRVKYRNEDGKTRVKHPLKWINVDDPSVEIPEDGNGNPKFIDESGKVISPYEEDESGILVEMVNFCGKLVNWDDKGGFVQINNEEYSDNDLDFSFYTFKGLKDGLEGLEESVEDLKDSVDESNQRAQKQDENIKNIQDDLKELKVSVDVSNQQRRQMGSITRGEIPRAPRFNLK
jgi:hypothetical protein